MGTKAKAAMAAALLVMAITLGACTPKVQLPILRAAPDFTLTNQDGPEVKLSDFRGKVVVMDFIYANCHDACLTMNYKLKFVQDQLEVGLKEDLILISVSFDPLDTPEVLRGYAAQQGFNVQGWQFLTGTLEQIRRVTDDYRVVYEAVEVEAHEHEEAIEGGHVHEGSAFRHNTVVVLIDQDGMVRKTYGYAEFPETELISDITSLIRES